MREILFRAKVHDGNKVGPWCYGQTYCYRGTWLTCDAAGKLHTIDKKTISEWTGLHDMSGKQIFEGDILSGLVQNNGLVPHYPAGALLEADVAVQYAAEGVEGAGWYVVGEANGRVYGAPLDAYEATESWTVTGNIYDNPELAERIATAPVAPRNDMEEDEA